MLVDTLVHVINLYIKYKHRVIPNKFRDKTKQSKSSYFSVFNEIVTHNRTKKINHKACSIAFVSNSLWVQDENKLIRKLILFLFVVEIKVSLNTYYSQSLKFKYIYGILSIWLTRDTKKEFKKLKRLIHTNLRIKLYQKSRNL